MTPDAYVRIFETPSSSLLDILRHLCMICNFFQVKWLKDDWGVTAGYPSGHWRISWGCLKDIFIPFLRTVQIADSCLKVTVQALDDASFKNPSNIPKCPSNHWRIMWPLQRCDRYRQSYLSDATTPVMLTDD